MERLRVAQIGAGYWGPNLLRAISANSRCSLRKVADISEERRAYVTQNFSGVEVCPDHAALFNDPEIDAVVIATPVATHFQLVMEALTAGKHVLVEKPLARSIEEAEAIVSLAREKKLTVMVGHTFLYNPAVRLLRSIINSGELGQVRYIYSQRLNLGRIRSDVDALWNLAPHDISIMQYLFGDPTPLSISACGVDYVQRGIADVVFVNLLYPNKVMVNLHVSWLDPHRVRRITVVGSEKMAVFDDAAEKKICIFDKGIDRMAILSGQMDYDKPVPLMFSHRAGREKTPELEWKEPLQVEIDHFVDVIVNKVPCLTGPEHALRVVKILCACEEAMKRRNSDESTIC